METKHSSFADAHLPAHEADGDLDPASEMRARPRNPSATKTALRRNLYRAAIAAVLLALPGAALAGTVKGKVSGAAKLLNPVWNEAKDLNARRWTFREFSPTVRPDLRNLTGLLSKELCITALAADKGAPLKVAYRMSIAGGRTTPVTLVVAEGQQIQFENRDPFPHKLYETSGKGGLVVAEILPTKSRAWTPPGPGKYEFRDEVAPSVRSWVVVEPKTVAVTYPDRKGDFAIELDPGTYKLRGYFNGEPVGKEVEVTVAGADLVLPNPLSVAEGAPAPAAPSDPAGSGG